MSESHDRFERADAPTAPTPRGRDGVSRRRLMAAGAAGWATVALAGCSDSGGSSGNQQTTSTTASGTTSDYTATTRTSTTTTGGDSGGAGTTTTTPPTTTTTQSSSGGGDGDTTTGGKNCGLSNVFAPGMDVGFLVDVFDSASGARLDEAALAAVTVSFPDAEFAPIDLTTTGPHVDHVPDKWGGKLVTPADAEPGVYRYDVSVTASPDAEPESILTDEFRLVDVGN